MTVNPPSDRFQIDAHKYAGYLESPEGRLRLDLSFANLQELLPQFRTSPCALDIGGGTGATAVKLAGLGLQITLLDSSLAMLEIAKRNLQDAGVGDKVTLQHGDASQAEELLDGRVFDVILCHNVMEYVERPSAVLAASAHLLRRDPPGLISILVRNRAGEVLKAAVQAGDLECAERNLTAEWGVESLYGGRVRLFTPDEVHAMSRTAGLEIIAERGVRVVADYLPPRISREAEYESILKLERTLGQRPEFAAVARYTQYFARGAGTASENVA